MEDLTPKIDEESAGNIYDLLSISSIWAWTCKKADVIGLWKKSSLARKIR